MFRIVLPVIVLCAMFISHSEAQIKSITLMPLPKTVQVGSGQLLIDPSFSVAVTGHAEPRLENAVELFLTQLRRQTGMPPIDMKVTNSATATLVIQCAGGTKEVQQLGRGRVIPARDRPVRVPG